MKATLLIFLCFILVEAKRGRHRPCGGRENTRSCICSDGSIVTVEGSHRICGRKRNLQSCTCADLTTWTPPPRRRRPCEDGGYTESCLCSNGITVQGGPRHCGRREDGRNNVESCTCADGTTWTPPSNPGEGYRRK